MKQMMQHGYSRTLFARLFATIQCNSLRGWRVKCASHHALSL